MKIIISGDGEVGFYLAKLLAVEFQDIIFLSIRRAISLNMPKRN
jgi:hypothetical protein